MSDIMNDFVILSKNWAKSVGKCMLECTVVFFVLCAMVAFTLSVDYLDVLAKYALVFVFALNTIGVVGSIVWAFSDRYNLLYDEDDTANWCGTPTRAGRYVEWILTIWINCVVIGLIYVCMVAWM